MRHGLASRKRLHGLKRKKQDNEACGEIETHHLGSRDTFYVGAITGVGRIYQQTFVDTYSNPLLPENFLPP